MSLYIRECVCLRVFDGDHARSAAALSNREHVRERAAAAAKRDTAQNAGSFFSLLFFCIIFFLAAFLAFSLQRFKYRISRVSGYGEYDNNNTDTHTNMRLRKRWKCIKCSLLANDDVISDSLEWSADGLCSH